MAGSTRLDAPRLRAVALVAGLAACGGEAPHSGGSTSGTTDDSSGASADTSGMVLADLGDPGDEAGCVVEVWSRVHAQDGWRGGHGGLARAGGQFQAVGRLGGARVTLAVTGAGDLAWGPALLAGTDAPAGLDAGVLGLAGGDAWTIASDDGGAWLERWSATGDLTTSVAIPGEGYRLGPAALTPDGGIVAGGHVGDWEQGGEAVLMSLSAAGAPAWDIRLDHHQVASVAVDRAGAIFVLEAHRYIEGSDVHLAALGPTGLRRWSVVAGSNAGFAVVGAATPFALAPDGEGGVYTLGHRHHLATPEAPASDELLLARYLPTGALAWEARAGAPDVVEGGGLAVVGDDWLVSAVDTTRGASLVVHRVDGTFLCERPLPDRRVRAVVTAAQDEVVLTGQVTSEGPAWFARYRLQSQ